MRSLFQFRRVAVAGLIALGLAGLGGSTAKACGGNVGYVNIGYAQEVESCVHAQWVYTRELRQVPYTVLVPRYDHCGHRFLVEQTAYRTVAVPVKKLVLVSE